MFTGIVEELGEISGRQQARDSIALFIKGKKVMPGLEVGDSVAVNGVCLTVAQVFPTYFYADVMPETLRKTNLNELKNGDKVNLERALPAGGRLGGHFCQRPHRCHGENSGPKKRKQRLVAGDRCPCGGDELPHPQGFHRGGRRQPYSGRGGERFF